MDATAEQTSSLAEALVSHHEMVEQCREKVASARLHHKRPDDPWLVDMASEDSRAARVLAEGLKSGKFTIGDETVEVEVKAWADVMDGETCVGRVHGTLRTDGTSLEALDAEELREEFGELTFDWVRHARLNPTDAGGPE